MKYEKKERKKEEQEQVNVLSSIFLEEVALKIFSIHSSWGKTH